MKYLSMLVVTIGALFCVSGAALAQNSCYNCHLAQQRDEDSDHLRDWRDSVHERAGVGCEDCHGGDASTLVQFSAHRGVLHSSLKKSPTHWRNLPTTCGQCHQTLLTAVQGTPHWTLLEQGERRAPSCATCHGTLAVAGLGQAGLSGECSTCHEADSEIGRLLSRESYLRRMREVRASGQRVGRRVLQIRDAGLRHDAGTTVFESQQAWDEAMKAAHSLELDEMMELLSLAETKLAELEAALDSLGGEDADEN